MRALTLLLTAAMALLVPVPATATAIDGDPFPFPCFFAPSPGSGWLPVASGFAACAPCGTAGEAGVSRGDWEHYHCAFVPIGLDGSYWLFVPEAAQLTTTTPDPYVAALAPANEVPVTDPANLTGPPDDRFATVTNPSTRPYRYLKILTGPQTAQFDSMRTESPLVSAFL